MNVALIMERIETWRGGAETSTMQFAHHLARLGCKISILTTTLAQSTSAITIIPIKASGAFRASKTHLFSRRAADYVRKHPFDIVHAITPCIAADIYQPRGGTVPETLQRNLALRSSVLQKGFKKIGQKLSLKYRVVGELERKLLERVPPPWVIAISSYVREQLTKHYQFDLSRVREIFNGIDPDTATAEERENNRRRIRRQFGLAEDAVVALCVAHNFKLKGVGKLIEALKMVRSADFAPTLAHMAVGGGGDIVSSTPRTREADKMYVVIVGRDNLTSYVRLAERLGVSDRVIFAGPTQRIQAFFHAADLLVHPTFYDPCSRVVLEALAAGLPVITTGFNGAAERITDGQEGYVIDSPDHVEALAERMIRLLDREHRQNCAARAAASVNNFTMARHAAAVLQLYEELLNRGDMGGAGYR